MHILREKNFSLSKDEYLAIRRLVSALNFTIRNFFDYVKKFQESAKQIEKLNSHKNPEIQKLYKNYAYALFEAFFRYTPFIRSKFLLNLLIYIFKASLKISENYFATESLNFILWLKRQAQETGIPLSYLRSA